jgi:hypothetical protein
MRLKVEITAARIMINTIEALLMTDEYSYYLLSGVQFESDCLEMGEQESRGWRLQRCNLCPGSSWAYLKDDTIVASPPDYFSREVNDGGVQD